MEAKEYIEVEQALGTNLEEIAGTTTDARILSVLAEHEGAWVRWCVADNPNTPINVLEKLSNCDLKVIAQAAEETLRKLSNVAFE